MLVGMIGRKVGMMRLYDGEGRARGVTAIELGPNRVTEVRTIDRDGYEAVQIAFTGNRRRLTRPQRGHLRRAGVEEALGTLREFRCDDASQFELGQELRVDEIEAGQFVDVTGVSKGRGFSGGVRRWGFSGGPKTHGQSADHRAPGSIGAGTTPGRVWRGQKMAGRMGTDNKTVRNLLVVLIDPSRNLIFVEGSVPGHRQGLVTVSPGVRTPLDGYQPPADLPPLEAVVEVTAEPEPAEAGSEPDEAAAAEAAEAGDEPETDVAETAGDGGEQPDEQSEEETGEEPDEQATEEQSGATS